MKKCITIFFLMLAGIFVLSSCEKMLDGKDSLPPYASAGNASVLSSDVTSVSPKPADSSTAVINFTWTNPKYSIDSSTVKYILEIDSSATNNSGTFKREITGALATFLTGKQLNSILLDWGFVVGEKRTINAKIISSYPNNNQQYASNVVTIQASAYADSSVLTGSPTDITCNLSTANDKAVDFSWTSAFNGYSGSVTYTLQYDTTGKGFSNVKDISVDAGLFVKSLTQGDLNIDAINAGIIGGTSGKMDFRIKAVTALGAIVYSNTVTINVKTFISAPDNLYIVGDATVGGWSNPVPVPSQQFTKVDAYSFSIIAKLNAAPASYLFLPVNGDWSHKYGGASASGGTLLKDGAVPGSNTPAPASAGFYKIVVNFQTNSYSVTPITIPSNLYIVGDATAGGWSNPVPTPAQQFTQLSPGLFGIITNLSSSGSYLFLPVNGDWSHKYGGASATGGTLLADADVPSSNTPPPSSSGLYKIIVNFATNTYTVTPYTGMPVPSNLYIVGDATAGGWSNPVPTPSQQFTRLSNGEFKITVSLNAAPASYLFLPVNGDWSHKYGGASASGGTLLYDGDVPSSNTPAPSSGGSYTIDVNYITGTYSVQ
jgi:hypothetical protein